MTAKLTAEMKRVVSEQRLAYVATVCPDGTLVNQSFDERKIVVLRPDASDKKAKQNESDDHFRLADNSLGRPLGLPCRSSVGCLDRVVVNLLLMHGCGRSVGPLCNFDCEHKNRRQPFRLGGSFDDFVGLRETWARRENHSERSACMTSTRAARAAGSIEATTAAPNSTAAETITGIAPGIFKSPK